METKFQTREESRDELWDYLVENEVASKETLQVVTNINGFNLESLESVLFATTGYRDLDQIINSD